MNISESLKSIRQELDTPADVSDPDGVASKLVRLSSLEGLSVELIAETNKEYNVKLANLMVMPQYKSLSATDKKLVFAGVAANEIYNMQLAEGYNKEIHYQIEGVRSLISKLKEEMKNSKFI